MRISSCFLLVLLLFAIFATPSASQVVLSHPTIHVLTAKESTATIATTKRAEDAATTAKTDVNAIKQTLAVAKFFNSANDIATASKTLDAANVIAIYADSVLTAARKSNADRASVTDWRLETFRMGATGGLETKGNIEVPNDPSAGLIFQYNPHWNSTPGWFGMRRITGYIAVNTGAGSDTIDIDKSSVQGLILPGASNTLASIGFEIAFRIDRNHKDLDINDITLYGEFSQSKYTVRDTLPDTPVTHNFSSHSLEIGIRWAGVAKSGKSSYGAFSIGTFLRGYWIDESGKLSFVQLNNNLGVPDVPTTFRGVGFVANARFNQFGVEFRWVNLRPRGKDEAFSEEIPGVTGGIFSLQTTFTGDIFGG